MDDWADAVLESYPGRLILVGASMGGYTGLAAAARRPSGWPGCCSPARGPEADTPERYAKRAETIASRASAAPRGSGRRCARPSSATTATPRSSNARALALDRTGRRARDRARGDPRPARLTAAYRGLGDRALTVVGDRDPFVPVEDARRFEPDAS